MGRVVGDVEAERPSGSADLRVGVVAPMAAAESS